MWQRRHPSAACGRWRQPLPARVVDRFEQRLAVRHMMLHWLATEQATAAIDTGKSRAQRAKPPRLPSHSAEEKWRRKNQQVSRAGVAAAAKLTDLLDRCQPAKARPTTSSHPAQSRLAQMPWCYQGPLRQAQPSRMAPAALKDAEDNTPLEFEDQESGLDRGAPYLDFLELLTERLVQQPQLSSEALHAVCESCIASDGGDLDPDILWELTRELFADRDQEEDYIES